MEEILESFDHIEPLEAPNYFYSKLITKLDNETNHTKVRFVLKPVLLTICLTALLIINLVFINRQKEQLIPTIEHQEKITIEEFAKEYNF